MVLTPTVLPNSFSVLPDLSFPYLLQARGSPCYGFCALEMPQVLLIPICLVRGLRLLPVLLISIITLQIGVKYYIKARIFIGNFGRFPVLRCRIAVPT